MAPPVIGSIFHLLYIYNSYVNIEKEKTPTIFVYLQKHRYQNTVGSTFNLYNKRHLLLTLLLSCPNLPTLTLCVMHWELWFPNTKLNCEKHLVIDPRHVPSLLLISQSESSGSADDGSSVIVAHKFSEPFAAELDKWMWDCSMK